MAEPTKTPKKPRAAAAKPAAAKPAAAESTPKAKKTKASAVAAGQAPVELAVAAPAAVVAPVHTPSHEEIRRRAYELWLAHGGNAGENWLEAERQLRG
jgi:hypothetical protein